MTAFLKQLHILKTNAGTSTGNIWIKSKGETIVSYSPADGKEIGRITATDKASYDKVMEKAQEAFLEWRNWPAPKRGEIVRQIGEALRVNKAALGQLVSYEMGKSLQEGLGEVQEMIDICDFAVGLS
ncbi:MAG TPA: aldehyde dehydrogenase family protein, partial [Ferruginibacter sp.]|nr:aldehyde dehydrogenase family protein [Ferruginibacter sp.]